MVTTGQLSKKFLMLIGYLIIAHLIIPAILPDVAYAFDWSIFALFALYWITSTIISAMILSLYDDDIFDLEPILMVCALTFVINLFVCWSSFSVRYDLITIPIKTITVNDETLDLPEKSEQEIIIKNSDLIKAAKEKQYNITLDLDKH